MARGRVLDRIPLRWCTAVSLGIVIGAVAFQLIDGAERRDIGFEIASWSTGVGEIAFGLVIVLAMIRDERRAQGRTAGSDASPTRVSSLVSRFRF